MVVNTQVSMLSGMNAQNLDGWRDSTSGDLVCIGMVLVRGGELVGVKLLGEIRVQKKSWNFILSFGSSALRVQ